MIMVSRWYLQLGIDIIEPEYIIDSVSDARKGEGWVRSTCSHELAW